MNAHRVVSSPYWGWGRSSAVVLSAGGVVAVPQVAVAAPWTVYDLSQEGDEGPLASTLVGPGITVTAPRSRWDATAAGTFNDPAASLDWRQELSVEWTVAM